MALTVGCLGVLLAAGRPAAAQTASPWVRWTVVQVAPAMVDDFVAVQREFMARAKAAGTPWRRVSRTEAFGDTYRFLIATPIAELASLDADPEAEAKPDLELEALIRRAERAITSRQSYAIRALPEIDSPLPNGQAPDLMLINIARVAPGREQEYLRLMLADFLPHFEEAGIHHVTGALTFGGGSGYIHVFYLEDFATLDAGSPVVAALGAQGAQDVTAKFAGVVSSSEQWLARRIPELSYEP